MSILGTFTKQPREVLDYDILYSTVLAGRTDTIASVTSEVSPGGGLTATAINTADKCKVVVSGGTTSVVYKVTVLATTTEGLIYEDEVNVLVEEV